MQLVPLMFGPAGLPAFLQGSFRRAPAAAPDVLAAATELMTWETFASLLPRAHDVLLAREGALVDEPIPRAAPELARAFAAGTSLVVRKAETLDVSMRSLAAEFGAAFGGASTIHLFATPSGATGFGWHYDCEDVFLVQTAGVKQYYLRQNTVNPQPRATTMPKNLSFERETTPTASCTLAAGDWLYIPSGWWHVAKAAEHSLAISIGVLRAESA